MVEGVTGVVTENKQAGGVLRNAGAWLHYSIMIIMIVEFKAAAVGPSVDLYSGAYYTWNVQGDDINAE